MWDSLYVVLWANLLRRILTVCAVGALIAAAVVFWPGPDGPESCAKGVEKSAGECIGINGSGYDFGTPEITAVARAIAKENETFVGDKPHVTIAMVLPLHPELAAERAQLRSEIQGAYLAQYRENRKDEAPLLRLVLANPGTDYAQQAKVVDQLGAMAQDKKDNLRAVTGFNLSLQATKDAITRLTKDLGIPVLASRISGDDPANPESGTDEQPYPGLARIIPTNTEQAAALAHFHGGLRDAETVLVKDTRPGDIYNASLARAFSHKEAGPPGPKDQPFRSPSLTELGDTGNDFAQISLNICDSDAHYVYFAGRPVHLRLFALKLAETPCHDKKYTIVSGSGAATLNRYMKEGDWEALRGGGGPAKPTVTVQYTAPGHPAAWDTELKNWDKSHPDPKSRPAYLTQPQQALNDLRRLVDKGTAGDIGPVRLDDSRTMLVHDGVMTIGEAVFLANQQTEGIVPSLSRIIAEWPRLESAHHIVGTSGWICLTNAGNAYDKPVAVVELDPKSRQVNFVGIGWPKGEPQPKSCVVPSGDG
ncbi:amino acid ABC transporter substrate-binding protein [Streptomyces sp. NPDC050085]|uniref:amino acid ABC transporter substrate-binding protein n=1 Tax=Streptomyces sp. NPDC050085 TaxID=3365600 RepID=UPI0037AFF8B4